MKDETEATLLRAKELMDSATSWISITVNEETGLSVSQHCAGKDGSIFKLVSGLELSKLHLLTLLKDNQIVKEAKKPV